MGLASGIQPWAPTLARLVASFVMASLLPFAASAAGETTPLTDSDLRWLCQQSSVARVKVTRIDVDAPDAVCEGSLTGDGCRTVAAEVIVLESLPLLGAKKGLPLKPFLSNGPNRVRVKMASRAYADLKEAPFALVGVEGLLAMRDRRLSHVDSGAEHVANVDRLELQRQRASFDPGSVDQIVDEPSDVLHLPFDDDSCALARLQPIARPHHRQRRVNRRERVAQLMGQEP